MPRHFRDLIVWNRAIELVVSVYGLAGSLPTSERFGLATQLQRAAVSIPSNIAEGHERRSRKDYRRFLLMAIGSLAELETQLVICERLELLSSEQMKTARHLADEVGRMLRATEQKLLDEPRSPTTVAELRP